MKPVSILIVEDDPPTLLLLVDIVVSAEWQAITAINGREALEKAFHENPDLIILNLRLSKADGFEVFRKLRERSSVPIIAFIGLKEIEDKLKCFEFVADDYITKPFAAGELVTRIRNVLGRNIDKNPFLGPVITVGQIRIDCFCRRVFRDGQEVVVSRTEFELLKELVLHKDITLTNHYLLSRIWGPEFLDAREYLYTYINLLRKKLEPDPKHPRYIICESKFGYRLQDPAMLSQNKDLSKIHDFSLPKCPGNKISGKADHV